ncbi:hypothetical protein [Streptomyces anulatus]|uniref:hypothetical protein n=1 Tax=Streptomyces anulatus TaxID=1892 RepID=UPI003F49BEAC
MADDGQNNKITAGLAIVASVVTVLAFFNIENIEDLMSSDPEDACSRAWDSVEQRLDGEAASGLREASSLARGVELRHSLREAADAYSKRENAESLIEVGRLTKSVDEANARWQSFCT